MNNERPQFVLQNELTDAGRKVVTYLEAGVNAALAQVNGQDVSSLNHMSGPFQDYYIHVMAMKTISPTQFVKERTYAVESIWQLMVQQEQVAAEKAQQEQTNTSLTDRLAKLEKALTEALAKLAEEDKTEPPAADDSAEDEPAPVAPAKKKSKAEAAEPPAPDAGEADEKDKPE